MLTDLHPARLPEDFAALHWPEALAAMALGLLLALAVYALLRPVLHRRPRRATLPELLQQMQTLPPEDRLIAELRLLHDLGAKPRGDLYSGPTPDLSEQIKRAWDRV